MSFTQLAKHLSKYKIKSKNVTIYAKQKKGYDISDFKDAFSRYLPKSRILPVQPSKAINTNAYSNNLPVQNITNKTDRNESKPLLHKAMDGRTDKSVQLSSSDQRGII